MDSYGWRKVHKKVILLNHDILLKQLTKMHILAITL